MWESLPSWIQWGVKIIVGYWLFCITVAVFSIIGIWVWCLIQWKRYKSYLDNHHTNCRL